jgi:SAM-dependent methyltransferase
MPELKLSIEIQERLQCPVSGASLHIDGEHLSTPKDEIQYSIYDGVPVVIDEANSICNVEEIVAARNASPSASPSLLKWLPSTSLNVTAKTNYSEVIRLLPQNAKILVIGGASKGAGTEELYSNLDFDIVGLDVYFGSLADIIADAHSIPFKDETFDCVIIQAVLEYLVDPRRCAEEIHRVLKQDGIVYSEIPFMQRVHGGKSDFGRFTHLGHLRLFRQFEEVKSGPCCGPGMALAGAWTGFLRSFVKARYARFAVMLLARFTTFYLKYFDYFLINKPGAYDAASGTFFLGRKSNTVLPDKELIKRYRGLSGK